MKKVILLRFGELFLKGKNRDIFERRLIDDIKNKLGAIEYKFFTTLGRYIISDYDEGDEDRIVDICKRVFGLYSLSRAVEIESKLETIEDEIAKIDLQGKSFKVSVKRADKSFPIHSMELASMLGSIVCEHNPKSEVELYMPQIEVHVEIRNNGRTYIYYNIEKCQGGLPLGSSGRALLLLSGGIDSPVAGYMMAKRGLTLHALHFHSYPYTSENAKQKVIELAQKLSGYCGKIKLHVVSFTRIQEAIHVNCIPEYMITIMRRIMMRIAQKICEQNNLSAIITGESLGQVASQTCASMTVTGSVVDTLPIFRPCIGMDKEQIMQIARDIDTYDISIRPYEDCCTVFLPKYPVINPTIERAQKEESRLNLDKLIADALSDVEEIEISTI